MGKLQDKKNKIELENGSQKSEKKVPKVKKVVKKTKTAMIEEKQKRKRVRVKSQVKDVEITPQALKCFEKEFDKVNEGIKTENKGKLSKGQIKRQEKQKSIQKKKFFSQYLEQLKSKNKQNATNTFVFGNFKSNIEEIEKKNKEEMISKQKKAHQGVSVTQRTKLQYQEQERMKQILNFAPFQSNPMATLKMHIENNLRQQGKM